MKTIQYTLWMLLACLTLGSCQDVEDPADTVPTVITDAVEKYSSGFARLSGSVTSRAECYFLISTSEDMSNPQKIETYPYRNKESEAWTCNLEINLNSGTTYYVVLCATDGRSEVRGNMVSFTTLDTNKAKIGDYYYSDGTWSTKYNPSKQCIGIVFALSEKANGDINVSLTASEHGRIVALEDAGQSRWGTSSHINENFIFPGLTGKITEHGYLPIDGKDTYSVPDVHIPYNYENWLEAKDESHKPLYALCDYQGSVWTHFFGYGDTAAAMCYAYKAGKVGWFLPSVGEIARLAMAYGYGKISHKNILYSLEGKYWTSCIFSASYTSPSTAWSYHFSTGSMEVNYIGSVLNVRPIASF